MAAGLPLTPAEVALIAANAAPLIGVLFFGWELFDILFLYWVENLVVGFYTILKLVVVTGLASIVAVPIFLFHYSWFMSAHAALLFAFLGRGSGGRFSFFIWHMLAWPPLAAALHDSRWPAVALLASHGVSFITNFIAGREYQSIDAEALTVQPYRRLMVMHCVVLGTGFAVMLFGAPVLGVVTLVVLKAAIDLRAHRREHSARGSLPRPERRSADDGAERRASAEGLGHNVNSP
jgi:hypothetical protein